MKRILIAQLGPLLHLGLRDLLSDDARFFVQEYSSDDLAADLHPPLPDVLFLDLDREATPSLAERITADFPAITVLACSSLRAVMRVYPGFRGGEYRTTTFNADSVMHAVGSSMSNPRERRWQPPT